MGDASVLEWEEHPLSDPCAVLLPQAYLWSRLSNPCCRPILVAAGSERNRGLKVYIVAWIPLSFPAFDPRCNLRYTDFA
jgi:hypothetical protein